MAMNKRMILPTVLAVLVTLTMGARLGVAQDVTVNFAPGVDLSNFRGYEWVKIEGAMNADERLDTQIKRAIESALESHGLTKARPDYANQLSLFLAYQVAVTQPQAWKVYSTGGIAWEGGAANTPMIGVGAIELHMYDPKTKRMVWQGRATNTLAPSSDPNVRQERLNAAMAKLLEGFPPKPKK